MVISVIKNALSFVVALKEKSAAPFNRPEKINPRNKIGINADWVTDLLPTNIPDNKKAKLILTTREIAKTRKDLKGMSCCTLFSLFKLKRNELKDPLATKIKVKNSNANAEMLLELIISPERENDIYWVTA